MLFLSESVIETEKIAKLIHIANSSFHAHLSSILLNLDRFLVKIYAFQFSVCEVQVFPFVLQFSVTQIRTFLLRRSSESSSTEIMKKLSKFHYWVKETFL